MEGGQEGGMAGRHHHSLRLCMALARHVSRASTSGPRRKDTGVKGKGEEVSGRGLARSRGRGSQQGRERIFLVEHRGGRESNGVELSWHQCLRMVASCNASMDGRGCEDAGVLGLVGGGVVEGPIEVTGKGPLRGREGI